MQDAHLPAATAGQRYIRRIILRGGRLGRAGAAAAEVAGDAITNHPGLMSRWTKHQNPTIMQGLRYLAIAIQWESSKRSAKIIAIDLKLLRL